MLMVDIRLLGSGDTLGVPVYGSDAQGNTIEDLHAKRTRFGLFLRYQGRTLLIDTNPDLKWQCLEQKFALSEVDIILITHTHSDHLNGMGEFWQRRKTPTEVFSPSDALSQKNMSYFGYLEGEGVLKFNTYTPFESFSPLANINITPIELNHGFPCCGFVIEIEGKKVGIVSDSNAALSEKTISALKGCDLLFVDAFSEDFDQVRALYTELNEEAPVESDAARSWFHMNIQEAKNLKEVTNSKKACTVHMSRFMSPHNELVKKYQQDDFIIGCDGLKFQI
jgi:phosphoribosyl 1,2-cyclic phosphate phosphodiesterase